MRPKSINPRTPSEQWDEYCIIDRHDGKEFAKFFGGAKVIREEIDKSEYASP